MDTKTPAHTTEAEPQVQQLSLLPDSDVPVRFRLDAATRRRGIQHVAEIRQMLAERRAARETSQRPSGRPSGRPPSRAA